MAKENKPQKKKKGRSVQDLMGIKTFTKYGLATNKGELLFYLVSPTNISVLSAVNIEITTSCTITSEPTSPMPTATANCSERNCSVEMRSTR